MSDAPAERSLSVVRVEADRLRLWLGLALVAHTGWGAYPVLARYLQTQAGLPSMSLLAVSMTSVSLLLALTTRPRWGMLLRQRLLPAFLLAVLTRAVTNLLAARFTAAVYVQLVTLATPWVVAFFNALVFHETAPPNTGRTALLGTVGAGLMLSAALEQQGHMAQLGPEDLLGLALAGVSVMSLAWYMLLVRRSGLHQWRGQEVFFLQALVVMSVGWTFTLLLDEDWTPWLHLQERDWAVLLAFVGLVLFGANRLQIEVLQRIGARAVSALLPWRMVVVLVLGMWLLGERFTHWRQALGLVLVLAALVLYLGLPVPPPSASREGR